jgi:pilus assembly protein CpaB
MLMLVTVASLIGMYIVKGLFAVQAPVQRPRIVTIPLATTAIAPGTKISDTHVGMGPYPEKELTQDMLRSTRVIVGRVAKEAIKPGEPLRGSQLYEPGENAPLEVAAGKKAISITVKNSSEILDGLIQPGDYVDVHFTLDPQSSGNIDDRLTRLGGVSMTLLKGVKVLALNKSFRQSPLLPTGNSVTLELAPNQTNVLLVAQPRGTLSLSFNPDGEGDGGVALSNADRATLWEILGLKKATVPPVEEPEQPFVTESYRGTQSGSSQWDKNGKRFEARSGAATWQGSRYVDWPAGSTGNDRGVGGGTYWGSPSPSNPYDFRGRSGSGGGVTDSFDPNDVFLNQGGGKAAPQNGASPPDADPDIPQTQPGTAGNGVRSRVGSMLKVKPGSGGQPGPTALRN